MRTVDLDKVRIIIGNEDMTDDELNVLITKAQRQAANHYFWAPDDEPTDEQLEKFYTRYEYEIYAVAAAIENSEARGGLKSHSELGISMTWGKTGQESIEQALSAIPPKTYVGW